MVNQQYYQISYKKIALISAAITTGIIGVVTFLVLMFSGLVTGAVANAIPYQGSNPNPSQTYTQGFLAATHFNNKGDNSIGICEESKTGEHGAAKVSVASSSIKHHKNKHHKNIKDHKKFKHLSFHHKRHHKHNKHQSFSAKWFKISRNISNSYNTYTSYYNKDSYNTIGSYNTYNKDSYNKDSYNKGSYNAFDSYNTNKTRVEIDNSTTNKNSYNSNTENKIEDSYNNYDAHHSIH